MKEYLKMEDCFEMPLAYVDTNNGMHSMIDSSGDRISCEFLCDSELEVILHAINSHDELVQMNQELLAALEALFHETNQQNLSAADRMIAKAKGGEA